MTCIKPQFSLASRIGGVENHGGEKGNKKLALKQCSRWRLRTEDLESD